MHTVGIIGYGGMGEWHGRQLLTIPEEFKLAAVHDINPTRNELALTAGIKGLMAHSGRSWQTRRSRR